MAKTIKSLLRISMVIRSLESFNGCAAAKCFIRTTSSCGITDKKEALVSPQPHCLKTVSRLTLFRYCDDHTKVFTIVQTYGKDLKGAEAVRAMDTLFKIDKMKSQRTERIYEQEGFLHLCEILQKRMRELTVSDAINALKVFVHFRVPSTSVIVQSILQLLCRSVDKLTMSEIEFINFLSDRCERTPVLNALMVAMPIVYERNVLVQLDRENIKFVVRAFCYLSKRSENSEIVDVVMHAISSSKDLIDMTMAEALFNAIIKLQCEPLGLPDFFKYVQSIFAQNITNMDRQLMKTVMRTVAKCVVLRGQDYYHEGFVDACASVVISEGWDFYDAIWILKSTIPIGHTQLFLLDYLAAKCYEDPKILKPASATEVATFIHGLVRADYKPVYWDVIKESILPWIGSLQFYRNKHLKLALNLTALDCYCPELIETVFTNNATYFSSTIRLRRKLLQLYQAIKTLYPQYSGPWPTERCVVDVPPMKPNTTSDDFPLITTLESALGGRRYLLTNVRSRLGHVIDHVLVIRKGGFPVAINNKANPTSDEHPVRQLEELLVPPEAQTILILYLPTEAYSINSERLKGIWMLGIRTLEAMDGYKVIPIQSSMWTKLAALEKMPYLMQAIKLKNEDMSVSAIP